MQRNESIDIAKGIGVLLVVLGHNWTVDHNHGLSFILIFSFHMPLFFLLGGVFLNVATDFWQFVGSKIDTLLKPYIVVLTLVGFQHILVGTATPVSYFGGVLYGVGSTIEWVPMWFLPSLFITLVFAKIFLSVLSRFQCGNAGLFVAIVSLFTIGAWSIGLFTSIDSKAYPILAMIFGPEKNIIGLPLNLDLLPLSAAFLLLGYLLREKIRKPTFKPMYLIGATAIFLVLNLTFSYIADLNARLYGHWLTTPICAMSGIYIVISLSVLINGYSRILSRILAYLGRVSLFILIFHGYVEWRLMVKLTASLPIGDYPCALLGLLAAVVIPVIIYEITRRVSPLAWLLLPSPRRLKASNGMASDQSKQ